MRGFTPQHDQAAYFAELQRNGYNTKCKGGSPEGMSFEGIRVFHVTVIRGPGKPSCVLAAWRRMSERRFTYYSSRAFNSEDELNDWLKKYGINLSRHIRPL